ncbi:carboxymuconolactone decarboxylase family protein [Limnohabitans sp. TS-CS-82]|uniref:carboxymuconolactone decarboxylase family protein n=1 Tax=Limnohabitans sp. TS-CS-82 TaxID=2094193 RepID=UPI0011B0B333|nr:carboxymuconolactone decarboxylase family protein [Limnohabitans sp. TS-CS-82]
MPMNMQPQPDFEMRGNRFQPLTWQAMTAEQQAMTRAVLDGKRGSMQGPYNVLLRSPEVGQLAQQFGAQTRFNSSLPLALNELAILMVARDWTAQFVWWAHRRIAEEAGLSTALIQAIATGQSAPEDLLPEVRVVHRFCSELLRHKQVSDATYAEAVSHFGERGVVDLMATMSYYTLVCMSLNVDGYPLPEGAHAELQTLT